MSSVVVDRPPSAFNGNGEEPTIVDDSQPSDGKAHVQDNVGDNVDNVANGDSVDIVPASPNVYTSEQSSFASSRFSGPIFGTSAKADFPESTEETGQNCNTDSQKEAAAQSTAEELETAGDLPATQGEEMPEDEASDEQMEKEEEAPETPPSPSSHISEGKDKTDNCEMVIAKIEEVATFSPGHPQEVVEETPNSDKKEEEVNEDEDDDRVVIQEEIVETASHDDMPVLEPVLGELGGEMEVGTSRRKCKPGDPPEKYGVNEQGSPTKKPRKSTEAKPVGGADTPSGRRSLRSRATPQPKAAKSPRQLGSAAKKRKIEEPVADKEVEDKEMETEEQEEAHEEQDEAHGEQDEAHEEQDEVPEEHDEVHDEDNEPVDDQDEEEEPEAPKSAGRPTRGRPKQSVQTVKRQSAGKEANPSRRESLRSPRVVAPKVVTTPKQTKTPKPQAKPKPISKATPHNTPSKGKGKKTAAVKSVSSDPYDLDNLDSVPADIEVERDMFGSVRFTKPVTGGASRFKHTTKVAQRKSLLEDSPSQCKVIGKKQSVSTPRATAGSRSGSLQLFSDIDQDEELEELEEDTPKRAPKHTPTASGRKSRQSNQFSDSLPRSVKAPVEIPELSAEEQLNADYNPNAFSYVPGSRVLAKWKDKNFYPGQVVCRDGLGRYKVHFIEDAVDRDMPPPDVVGLTALAVGKTLMVTSGDEVQTVEIKEPPSMEDCQDWLACKFVVYNTVTETEEKVDWKDFIIAPEQAHDFIPTVVNEAAQSISMANVGSERTRLRRSLAVEPAEPPPQPVKPKTPKKRASPKVAVSPKQKLPKKEVEPVNVGEDEDVDTPDEVVLPLFKRCKFVLTSANRRQKADESESSDEERPVVPFNKRNVRQMIEDREGQVLDDFIACDSISNLFLVADTHYRTHKYLSALARAIPCVSHLWIHNSVQANEMKDYKSYMLSSGTSLETRQLVEWHDKCPTLLQGLTVLVHTENRPQNPMAMDFVQIWKPLVVCMAANAVDKLPPNDGAVDILLTDASCPAVLLAEAEKRGALAVSSEWLIQAIITGQRPDPSAHPKYRFDYVEQN